MRSRVDPGGRGRSSRSEDDPFEEPSGDRRRRIAEDLDELGLDTVDEQIIRDEYVCPYHGFLDEEAEADG